MQVGALRGAVLAAIVLLAACGDEDTQAPSWSDVPVLPSVRAGPGSEMRDGFEVEEGTVLVGTVFPDGIASPFGEITDEGWWALLFVSGEPSEVLEAYLAQAEAIGMARVAVPEGGPEFLREDLPADAQRYTACGVASEGGPGGYSCSGLALTDGGAPCLHVNLVRRPTGDTVESSLQLRYVIGEGGCVADGFHTIGDPDAPAPPLPKDWPELPAEGERLGAAFGMLADVEVAEGSGVAAPPFGDGGCGGSAAVLTASEDPMAVLEAYGSEFDALAPHAERTEMATRELRGGLTLREIRRQELGGGGTYAARLVERASEPALLVLSACPG